MIRGKQRRDLRRMLKRGVKEEEEQKEEASAGEKEKEGKQRKGGRVSQEVKRREWSRGLDSYLHSIPTGRVRSLYRWSSSFSSAAYFHSFFPYRKRKKEGVFLDRLPFVLSSFSTSSFYFGRLLNVNQAETLQVQWRHRALYAILEISQRALFPSIASSTDHLSFYRGICFSAKTGRVYLLAAFSIFL